MSGNVYNISNTVSSYYGLKEKNEELNRSLAAFYNVGSGVYKENRVALERVMDSSVMQQYNLIPGTVINNSINKRNNFLTLNIGARQGVGKEMAVIGPSGIVGVVRDVSDNFCTVISLLNQNLHISAMVAKNGYFGSLLWDGADYQYATLIDLPSHIDVQLGDTIATSGYSAMFPKGICVGTVCEINHVSGGDFLELKVNLATKFKRLSNVMVVQNLLRIEQVELEKLAQDD